MSTNKARYIVQYSTQPATDGVYQDVKTLVVYSPVSSYEWSYHKFGTYSEYLQALREGSPEDRTVMEAIWTRIKRSQYSVIEGDIVVHKVERI